jgi:hypothetical protein
MNKEAIAAMIDIRIFEIKPKSIRLTDDGELFVYYKNKSLIMKGTEAEKMPDLRGIKCIQYIIQHVGNDVSLSYYVNQKLMILTMGESDCIIYKIDFIPRLIVDNSVILYPFLNIAVAIIGNFMEIQATKIDLPEKYQNRNVLLTTVKNEDIEKFGIHCANCPYSDYCVNGIVDGYATKVYIHICDQFFIIRYELENNSFCRGIMFNENVQYICNVPDDSWVENPYSTINLKKKLKGLQQYVKDAEDLNKTIYGNTQELLNQSIFDMLPPPADDTEITKIQENLSKLVGMITGYHESAEKSLEAFEGRIEVVAKENSNLIKTMDTITNNFSERLGALEKVTEENKLLKDTNGQLVQQIGNLNARIIALENALKDTSIDTKIKQLEGLVQQDHNYIVALNKCDLSNRLTIVERDLKNVILQLSNNTPTQVPVVQVKQTTPTQVPNPFGASTQQMPSTPNWNPTFTQKSDTQQTTPQPIWNTKPQDNTPKIQQQTTPVQQKSTTHVAAPSLSTPQIIPANIGGIKEVPQKKEISKASTYTYKLDLPQVKTNIKPLNQQKSEMYITYAVLKEIFALATDKNRAMLLIQQCFQSGDEYEDAISSKVTPQEANIYVMAAIVDFVLNNMPSTVKSVFTKGNTKGKYNEIKSIIVGIISQMGNEIESLYDRLPLKNMALHVNGKIDTFDAKFDFLMKELMRLNNAFLHNDSILREKEHEDYLTWAVRVFREVVKDTTE